MHSPVNLIVFNELNRDRIAEADAARRAREGKPAAPKRTRAVRFDGFKWLRRARVASPAGWNTSGGSEPPPLSSMPVRQIACTWRSQRRLPRRVSCAAAHQP